MHLTVLTNYMQHVYFFFTDLRIKTLVKRDDIIYSKIKSIVSYTYFLAASSEPFQMYL